MSPDTNQRKSPPPIFFIVALGLIAFGGYKFLPGLLASKSSDISTSTSTPTSGASPWGASPWGTIANRISLGNAIGFTFRTMMIHKGHICGVGAGLFNLSATFKAVGEGSPYRLVLTEEYLQQSLQES